jgi:chromate transporter
LVLWQLFLSFAKVGLFTFGSGYSMLALAQREIVSGHAWLSAQEFTDVVAIAEVTPGPIMVNLATFVGNRLAGIAGAVVATLGLTLGPIVVILVISRLYSAFHNQPLVAAAFRGLRPTMLALIAVALVGLGPAAIPNWKSGGLFVLVLAGALLFKVHPIILTLLGIAAGLAFFR